VTDAFTCGELGEYVNRAVGPDGVTVTAIDAVRDRVPFVPVTVTEYEPDVDPLMVHVDV